MGSDAYSLSSLLFLSGLASVPIGCAKGTEERAKTPPFAPTVGEGDDGGGRDSFDPFATSGDPGDSNDANDSVEPGPTQGEGETGVVTDSGKDEGTGLPDSTEGEGDGTGTTGGPVDPTAASAGEVGEASTGSVAGYDPCPYVADIYSECIESVTYEDELAYCQGVVQSAYDESPACGSAFVDYLVCLSFLDCASLLVEGVPPECASEQSDVQSACTP